MTDAQKPKPRKSTATKAVTAKTPIKKAATKKTAVKKVPAPKKTNTQNNIVTIPVAPQLIEEIKAPVKSKNVILRTVIITALISSLLTFFVTNHKSVSSLKDDQISFAAQTSGGIALSEADLITAVKKLNRVVYWTGPQKNAKYTLNSATNGQVFVRYLPDGKGLSDTSAKYRVIATYDVVDAYKSTQAAANNANGISITNPDGAAVFYNKATPTNVYVAYQNLNYQIEIFDPNNNVSINLASTSGSLSQIIKK